MNNQRKTLELAEKIHEPDQIAHELAKQTVFLNAKRLVIPCAKPKVSLCNYNLKNKLKNKLKDNKKYRSQFCVVRKFKAVAS